MLRRILNWRIPLNTTGLALFAVVGFSAAATGAYLLVREQPKAKHRSPSRATQEALGHLRQWWEAKMPVGSPAPDFKLPLLGGGAKRGPADFRGKKPVVLVFGSFSCDLFCSDTRQVEMLYWKYRDRAEFLFVSVAEAGHDIPGMEFVLDAEKSPQEHRAAVGQAMAKVGLTMPAVVDREGRVMNAYKAFPRRLVVVDRKGRIALDLGTGLGKAKWHFSAVDKWFQDHAPAGHL
jgi:peroxiredoxin